MSAETIKVRWSDAILDEGWTEIPNMFLKHGAELGLGPKDQVILIHLMGFMRYQTTSWPSIPTLAAMSVIPERTVRRRLRAMHLAGIIKIVPQKKPDGGYGPNLYDLGPLVNVLRGLGDIGRGGDKSTPRRTGGRSVTRLGAVVTDEVEASSKKQKKKNSLSERPFLNGNNKGREVPAEVLATWTSDVGVQLGSKDLTFLARLAEKHGEETWREYGPPIPPYGKLLSAMRAHGPEIASADRPVHYLAAIVRKGDG